MNKPLCTYPWAHQEIETNGDIKFCCASSNDKEYAHLDENGNHYNINTHTLNDAWNSKRMLKLRENLYNGVKAPECQNCWDSEERGMWSVRQAALGAEDSYPHIQDVVDKSVKNNFILDDSYPYFYQIQSGNTCNLACKICNSDYSITYGRFFNRLGVDDLSQFKYDLSETGRPDNEYAGASRTSKKLKKYNWPSKIGLKNIIGEKRISNITRLYLSGGEPTIILENLKFLEYLIECDHSKNIELVITTNTTMIHPRFIEIIKHFKLVMLVLSIDSVGPAIELQRYPVKWTKLEKNIDQYLQIGLECDHTPVSFNIVITALTLPYLDELLSFMDLKNKKIPMHKRVRIAGLVQMVDSSDFNLRLVPYDVVQNCREKIEHTLKKSSCFYSDDIEQIKNLIESLKNFTFNKENDYSRIRNALEILQKHHPEYDVREIYKIYY